MYAHSKSEKKRSKRVRDEREDTVNSVLFHRFGETIFFAAFFCFLFVYFSPFCFCSFVAFSCRNRCLSLSSHRILFWQPCAHSKKQASKNWANERNNKMFFGILELCVVWIELNAAPYARHDIYPYLIFESTTQCMDIRAAVAAIAFYFHSIEPYE